MPNMKPQILHLREDDQVTLQYLGAAVILQWENLPAAAQQAVWQQAESVGGLPPVTSLHERIKTLVGRLRN